MKVSQLMTERVVTATPDASLKEVAALLAEHGISGLPVVAGGELLGVVSETDIVYKERGRARRPAGLLARLRRRGAAERGKLEARTAGQAMTAPPVTIGPRRRVAEAARIMLDRGVDRLPVVDRGALVGIVTRGDLVRAFGRSDEEIAREIREDVVLRTFWIAGHDVEVTVVDGVATLHGIVDTRTLSELLPDFVRGVPGVVAVEADLAWRIDDRARRSALSPG